jgi:predicted small lipoprotein YifL
MLRQFQIVAIAVAALAAGGCGIKGPLVLPPPPAPPAATPAPAAAPTAPSSDSAKPDSAPAERKP